MCDLFGRSRQAYYQRSKYNYKEEAQNLFLRQVASLLEMDTAQLSKIEKGSRQLKKEQIPVIAEILKADKEELHTLWLADQVMEVLNGEPLADEALKSVAKKRTLNNEQNI